MATDPIIRGFNASAVRAGLRTAMRVGLPPETANQPAFYMPRVETSTENSDSEGVPFDPSYRPTYSAPTVVRVPCSIEYVDGDGKISGFGIVQPTKVILLLLDTEYAQVKGFEYVVISGIRFFYLRTETEKGLVSVGLWKIHCRSEDEG